MKQKIPIIGLTALGILALGLIATQLGPPANAPNDLTFVIDQGQSFEAPTIQALHEKPEALDSTDSIAATFHGEIGVLEDTTHSTRHGMIAAITPHDGKGGTAFIAHTWFGADDNLLADSAVSPPETRAVHKWPTSANEQSVAFHARYGTGYMLAMKATGATAPPTG